MYIYNRMIENKNIRTNFYSVLVHFIIFYITSCWSFVLLTFTNDKRRWTYIKLIEGISIKQDYTK